MDKERHKTWIIDTIQSCATTEQLESSRVLIGLFCIQMERNGHDKLSIRLAEDELLEAFLAKQALI